MTISTTLIIFGLMLLSYANITLGGGTESDEDMIHHLKNMPIEKIQFIIATGQSGVLFLQGGVALFGVM